MAQERHDHAFVLRPGLIRRRMLESGGPTRKNACESSADVDLDSFFHGIGLRGFQRKNAAQMIVCWFEWTSWGEWAMRVLRFGNGTSQKNNTNSVVRSVETDAAKISEWRARLSAATDDQSEREISGQNLTVMKFTDMCTIVMWRRLPVH